VLSSTFSMSRIYQIDGTMREPLHCCVLFTDERATAASKLSHFLSWETIEPLLSIIRYARIEFFFCRLERHCLSLKFSWRHRNYLPRLSVLLTLNFVKQVIFIYYSGVSRGPGGVAGLELIVYFLRTKIVVHDYICNKTPAKRFINSCKKWKTIFNI